METRSKKTMDKPMNVTMNTASTNPFSRGWKPLLPLLALLAAPILSPAVQAQTDRLNTCWPAFDYD